MRSVEDCHVRTPKQQIDHEINAHIEKYKKTLMEDEKMNEDAEAEADADADAEAQEQQNGEESEGGDDDEEDEDYEQNEAGDGVQVRDGFLMLSKDI